YISVDQLIQQPTMDPDYVSVRDYVETMQAGGSFGAGRLTPPMLADMLERDNREALRLVASIDVTGIDVSGNASLRYEVADVQAWANLGLHLAEKLRGAVALHTYRLTGDAAQQQAAITH